MLRSTTKLVSNATMGLLGAFSIARTLTDNTGDAIGATVLFSVPAIGVGMASGYCYDLAKRFSSKSTAIMTGLSVAVIGTFTGLAAMEYVELGRVNTADTQLLTAYLGPIMGVFSIAGSIIGDAVANKLTECATTPNESKEEMPDAAPLVSQRGMFSSLPKPSAPDYDKLNATPAKSPLL